MAMARPPTAKTTSGSRYLAGRQLLDVRRDLGGLGQPDLVAMTQDVLHGAPELSQAEWLPEDEGVQHEGQTRDWPLRDWSSISSNWSIQVVDSSAAVCSRISIIGESLVSIGYGMFRILPPRVRIQMGWSSSGQSH